MATISSTFYFEQKRAAMHRKRVQETVAQMRRYTRWAAKRIAKLLGPESLLYDNQAFMNTYFRSYHIPPMMYAYATKVAREKGLGKS